MGVTWILEWSRWEWTCPITMLLLPKCLFIYPIPLCISLFWVEFLASGFCRGQVMFGRPQTAYGHTKHEQISGSAKGIVVEKMSCLVLVITSFNNALT